MAFDSSTDRDDSPDPEDDTAILAKANNPEAVPARQARMLAELLANLFGDYYDMARRIKQGLNDPLIADGFPVVPTVGGGVEELSVISPFTVAHLRETADEVMRQGAIMAKGCETVLNRIPPQEGEGESFLPRRLR